MAADEGWKGTVAYILTIPIILIYFVVLIAVVSAVIGVIAMIWSHPVFFGPFFGLTLIGLFLIVTNPEKEKQ